jgi:malate synthase
VAHPDLVPVATEVFDRALGDRPHQKERLREEVRVEARELQDTKVPGGTITEGGVRNNISVALQYLSAWLGGNGAVAIFNLMEDAATAEISRAQLWQWVQNGARLADGRPVDRALYEKLRDEEQAKLLDSAHLKQARRILDDLVLGDFVEFLTLPAYEQLE